MTPPCDEESNPSADVNNGCHAFEADMAIADKMIQNNSTDSGGYLKLARLYGFDIIRHIELLKAAGN